MNCLDARRAILTEPQNLSEALHEHVRSCNACAAFKKDQLIFEQQLVDTMKVEAPEGLASRILLAQSTGKVQLQTKQRRIYAIAASFVLAVGVMIGVQLLPNTQPVEQLVLSHVHNEAKHLKDHLNVGGTKLQTIFSKLNMKVSGTFGKVNYAGNCDIRKRDGAHLIIQGKFGPVTVLIMPFEKVTKRLEMHDQRFHGVVIPTLRGSFAIVGEHDEILEPYVKQLGRIITM